MFNISIECMKFFTVLISNNTMIIIKFSRLLRKQSSFRKKMLRCIDMHIKYSNYENLSRLPLQDFSCFFHLIRQQQIITKKATAIVNDKLIAITVKKFLSSLVASGTTNSKQSRKRLLNHLSKIHLFNVSNIFSRDEMHLRIYILIHMYEQH